MAHSSGLTIRQHERQPIELGIEFVVVDAHRQQVRFSPGSAAASPTTIRGHAVDISSGGMGLLLSQYVPRMCEGTVRVYGPTPIDVTDDGSPVFEVIFEHVIKVRRIIMSSHEPKYEVGVSFVDPDPQLDGRVKAVRNLAHATSAAADTTGATPEAADAGGAAPDA